MLHKFGYSQYESKVYEALVSGMKPMDATMIVKHSGVPKAKIYEVISKLVEKGIALESVSEKKKLYSALPLPLVIEKLTAEFQADIEQLETYEPQKEFIDDHVWSLKEDTSIEAKLHQSLQQAQKSIRFSAWKADMQKYIPLLEAKEREGIFVEALVVGEVKSQLSHLVFFEPKKEHVTLERFRLLIVDDEEVIFAGEENNEWQAIKTRSQPFVRVFTDYFYHDVLLTKITTKYNDILIHDQEIMAQLLQLKY
ncbi:TrmB family transcriptional regulator [Paenibacillus selenitireducens]|uniref:TrmB family transcriptional regulator n=1 Tax=Paenibacillus selenitireducens TaxID=1324314 RepID=A0A1T2X5J9_9BACL|nr:helix-turn-helix domain-containing protein [Paenibacillus selenitireducens]OPA75168.1 TrmB family transcriptional regulator [Paenibacillus selenitireducens]